MRAGLLYFCRMKPLPSSPDLLFCLAGDVRANSRAIRQLDALASAGLSVEAVGIADADSYVQRGPHQLIHYARPSGSGPAWFWRIHRIFQRHIARTAARHYHASDLFVLPALARHAGARRSTVSFDSRELYPHVGATAGKPWASLFWALIERTYIRRANAVFTVNDSIADILAEKYRIARPLVIPNIPTLSRPVNSTYLRTWTGAADDELILLLQGHLKPGRGCQIALEAIPLLQRARLVFLGEGPLRPDLESHAREAGLEGRVHFHDLVPPESLLDVTASADIGLCLIEPLSESLRLSLPNKLFEYLRAGIPVLASDLPEIARVIRRFDVGECAAPLTPEAVATAVRGIQSDPPRMDRWRKHTSAVFETFDPHRASEAFANRVLEIIDS